MMTNPLLFGIRITRLSRRTLAVATALLLGCALTLRADTLRLDRPTDIHTGEETVFTIVALDEDGATDEIADGICLFQITSTTLEEAIETRFEAGVATVRWTFDRAQPVIIQATLKDQPETAAADIFHVLYRPEEEP